MTMLRLRVLARVFLNRVIGITAFGDLVKNTRAPLVLHFRAECLLAHSNARFGVSNANAKLITLMVPAAM